MCLAHASEEETAAALKLISETGEINARGCPITPALLERILAAAPRGENEKPLIKRCSFDRATFSGKAEFTDATFNGPAGFARANFASEANFTGATFSGVWFGEATFSGEANFTGATFNDLAEFSGANFVGEANFIGATFSRARFHLAIFCVAWFTDATFNDSAEIADATFNDYAGFTDVTFNSDARFDGTAFKQGAIFDGAKFEQARKIGPLLACRELSLDSVRFAQPVQIEVSSPVVSCRRARFPSGVQFRLRWARMVLDDTDLAAPSILAGIPRLSDKGLARREEQIARDWLQESAGEISERPQLVSLRRANVAGLGLSKVSVANCLFADAHNLDKLRLESDVSFATAPSLLSSGTPRWGEREVIAEERTWRADSWRPNWSRRRWVAPRRPDWLGDQPDVLEPGQIAGLYRALRKGREDVKDEPGAADF